MGEIPNRDQEEPKNLESKPILSEHLAEGFRPIMACVGTEEQYGGETSKIQNIESVGLGVDYYLHPEEAKNHNLKNAGLMTYVISPVDGKPKFTKALSNCTSLVAVGRENGSETELSILTHQDPREFLKNAKSAFVSHLRESLVELKEKCSKGSIDVALAGGDYYNEAHYLRYQESLELLVSVVQEVFGFEPTVISGPKSSERDNIYFDTAERRLYVVRPKEAILYDGHFKPSEIAKKKKEWEKENKNK